MKSEQLETEAEATRARIAAHLDELRGRMTPGQVVDQMADYVRDGPGGAFFRNLGRHVVDNPIPVTLVGAGLAWLMASNRPSSSYPSDDIAAGMSEAGRAHARGTRPHAKASASWTDDASRIANDWTGRAQSAASDLGARAGGAGSRLQQTAGSAAEAASSAYDAAAETSRRTADAVSRTAAATGHDPADFVAAHPLVLAGIGLAIGAALGAAFPSTELEDRLVGDASDKMKGEARDLAHEQMEKGRAVAAQAWEAKPELDQQLGGRDGEHASHDRTGAPSPQTEASHEAPLVPSHETAHAEASGDEPRDDLERTR